ncbi:MAG: hypothetical protein AB8D78_04975 [Akkermansiaceae bacterium]
MKSEDIWLRQIAIISLLGLMVISCADAQNEELPERIGDEIPMSDQVVDLRLTLLQTTNAFGADFYRRFKEAEKSSDERALLDSIQMLRVLCREANESHTLGDVVIRKKLGRSFNYNYRSNAIEVRQTKEQLGWQIYGSTSANQGRHVNLSINSRYFDGDMGDGIEMVSIGVSGSGVLSNGRPRILSRWSSSSRDIFLVGALHRSPGDKVLEPPLHHTWVHFDLFRKLPEDTDLDKHFPPLLVSDRRELMTRFSSELIENDEFEFRNGYSSSRNRTKPGDYILTTARNIRRLYPVNSRHPWFLPRIGYRLNGTVTFAEPYGRHVYFPYTRTRRPAREDINNHYLMLREEVPPFIEALRLTENDGPFTGAMFEIECYEDAQFLANPIPNETFLIQ